MTAESTRTGLFEHVAAVAERLPANANALVEGAHCLTYRQLVQAASLFRDNVAGAGVQRGDRVGVILGNRKEFLIAALGIWGRGAILLPLSPQSTQAELQRYLLDSAVRAVVAGARKRSTISALRDAGVPVQHAWLFDPDENRWLSEEVRGAPRLCDTSVDWDSPALTQYSTGSTGQPKRVTRTHGHLLGECRAVGALLHLNANDRVLGVAPFFHSYGLAVCALTTLLAGGTLYPVDSLLPDAVAGLIEREQLTALPGVPFMFKLLSELDATYDFSSLRFALSAGAALPAATARKFEAVYGVPIRQLYGSTETGAIATSDVNEPVPADTCVGAPIPGVGVDLLDDEGHSVSPGTEGLVCVRSPYAPTAYDTPVPAADSHFVAGGFHPGDLAKSSVDGQLTLCGRRRAVINVNGLKVDPTEVEDVILRLPGVSEAAVLGSGDAQSGERVKLVVVAADGITPETIRAHCTRQLAPFKCPQIIEFRRELPRSAVGKILRKDL